MKEVTLYTVVAEKRMVYQDHIDCFNMWYNTKPIYNMGGSSVRESISVAQIPVEHRVFYRQGDKKEYYIAMTDDVRQVFGLENKMLDDYKKLCELQKVEINGALKTNETLVKYKNDLLDEITALTKQLNKPSTLSFWQRLKFLFTGVLP